MCVRVCACLRRGGVREREGGGSLGGSTGRD